MSTSKALTRQSNNEIFFLRYKSLVRIKEPIFIKSHLFSYFFSGKTKSWRRSFDCSQFMGHLYLQRFLLRVIFMLESILFELFFCEIMLLCLFSFYFFLIQYMLITPLSYMPYPASPPYPLFLCFSSEKTRPQIGIN